jgi:hypothetical protein
MGLDVAGRKFFVVKLGVLIMHPLGLASNLP